MYYIKNIISAASHALRYLVKSFCAPYVALQRQIKAKKVESGVAAYAVFRTVVWAGVIGSLVFGAPIAFWLGSLWFFDMAMTFALAAAVSLMETMAKAASNITAAAMDKMMRGAKPAAV